MKIKSFSINWESLGAQFANEDSKNQSDFFKGMATEFSMWDSKHDSQMQMAYVAKDIKEDHKKILENALSILWYN